MTIRDYFENQRKLRETSVRAYMICLKKLNNNVEPTDLDFLKNFDAVFEFIKRYKQTTQRSYMIAVNQALKSLPGEDELKDIYEAQLDILEYDFQERMDKNEKSETEEKNWTTLAELRLVANYWIDELNDAISLGEKKKIIEVYKSTIISLLYTEIPAIRLDYATMKIVYDEKDIQPKNNYLLIENGEKHFILQYYKTSNRHKEKVFSPSPRLSKIIDDWLEINKSGYFLPNKKMDNAMSTNLLGKTISKVFEMIGSKITVNIIRHIWCSENVDLQILEKNKTLASDMCHTSNTQKNYIRV